MNIIWENYIVKGKNKMIEIENKEFDGKVIEFYSILPYRLECKLEELMINMCGDINVENLNANELKMDDFKNFDMSKKIDINDFLLLHAIIKPKIYRKHLDDPFHSLNDKFKEIGDYLFDKYIAQYNEKTQVKKKLTISPD